MSPDSPGLEDRGVSPIDEPEPVGEWGQGPVARPPPRPVRVRTTQSTGNASLPRAIVVPNVCPAAGAVAVSD
jgi:hypothetical protein